MVTDLISKTSRCLLLGGFKCISSTVVSFRHRRLSAFRRLSASRRVRYERFHCTGNCWFEKLRMGTLCTKEVRLTAYEESNDHHRTRAGWSEIRAVRISHFYTHAHGISTWGDNGPRISVRGRTVALATVRVDLVYYFEYLFCIFVYFILYRCRSSAALLFFCLVNFLYTFFSLQ